MKKLIFFCILSSVLCPLSSVLWAEDHAVEITTYLSSPDGEFQVMQLDSLTIGTVLKKIGLPLGTGGKGSVIRSKNGVKVLRSPGGLLTVSSIQFPRFKTDTVKRRVGMGLPPGTSPEFPLDIGYAVRGSVLEAYAEPDNYLKSAITQLAWSTAEIKDIRNGFSAIRGGYLSDTLNPMTIEADPLFVQTKSKKPGGFRGAVGFGSQGVGGTQDADYDTYNMIVGPSPSSGTAWARTWGIFCSREFKTDIRPLSFADGQAILKNLSMTTLYHYRYLKEPVQNAHIGFMAEEAPEMISHDRKSVNIGDSLGMLMASVKALKAEQDTVRTQLEGLKK